MRGAPPTNLAQQLHVGVVVHLNHVALAGLPQFAGEVGRGVSEYGN